MNKEWNELPLVLTVPDVCELLSFSKPTVLKLLKNGTLEGKRIGNNWRVPRESIKNFMGVS